MKYMALLRGINVGGKNKVEMATLKTIFKELGLQDVNTYINSGNVIFSDSSSKPAQLASKLENAIERKFGFNIKVLIRDQNNIKQVAKALPDLWNNNSEAKCDVMFLWKEVDTPNVIDQLIIKPDIDEVKYVPGALLWRADRDKVTRSGMMKIAGTDLYKKMTIRNCNTLRKLHEKMNGS